MIEGQLKAARSKNPAKIAQAIAVQTRRQAEAQDRYNKLKKQREATEDKYEFDRGGLAGFDMGGPSLAISGHEKNITKLEAIKKALGQ